MNTCNYTYSEMFLSQLFNTLGVFSGFVISTSVSIPMISYYTGFNVKNYFQKKITEFTYKKLKPSPININQVE